MGQMLPAECITVASVSWYSGDLIAGMLASLERTSREHQFRYLIADNTNGHDEELYVRLGDRCRILPFDPQLPAAWRARARGGSYAHGAALNYLFAQIETEIGLFVDPDCIFLMPGWDQVVTKVLRTAIAVGAPHHSRKISKYHHFPSPIFMAFHTEQLNHFGPDWTPYLLPARMEVVDQLRRIAATVMSRAGESVSGNDFYRSWVAALLRRYLSNSSKDTGWRLAREAQRLGLPRALFTPALHVDQLAKPFQRDNALLALLHNFELFLWQGEPIIAHFYGNVHRRRGNVQEALSEWQELGAQVLSGTPARSAPP
jgi:hypothetical protein